MFLHARPGCPALIGQGNVLYIQEIHIYSEICLKLVKSHPANLVCSTLKAHRVTSASEGAQPSAPYPAKDCWDLIITLVFAVSHQKNKIPPSNGKMMIKTLGKTTRVSREENNPLPHILADQTGKVAP